MNEKLIDILEVIADEDWLTTGELASSLVRDGVSPKEEEVLLKLIETTAALAVVI